ncbi:hypothetical protein SAMN04488541_101185 [Thermoflexibacter ruber]|uniref:DUF3037 domain-containing protein n=2 Tax=Thermoflexibacter ruber TaxID=1003 RepID=A0A1I2EXT8_9BACT|nr:hypothetical protein SAMN04488541_101185 [Thermoflexibacter ruber]
MKNNYYIPIYFQTNSYSAEKLVGGILFFSSEQIFLRIAESKIKATAQIGNASSVLVIRQTVRMLLEKIESQKHLFTHQYLEYLHNYSNGVVQFGEAKPLHLSSQKFSDFAFKFLGERINFHKVVNQKINNIKKFSEKIVSPYIFQVPSLKKLYKVTLKILVNKEESFIMQSIDFQNSMRTIKEALNLYGKIIKELESQANEKNKFALVVEKPTEDQQKEMLLNDFQIKNPNCEIISLNVLDERLKEIVMYF